MTDDILFDRKGDWGVITLNREAALNALTWDMAKAFRAKLAEWAGDHSVCAVLVRGAGEKAFCAGGDIRWLHEEAKKDPAHASEFFREEYRNNAAIYHFPKPYVAVIDGVVMGGGVGISVHGDFRIAGDRTLFAMPETGIGLFPDVGGGHFMPRLGGGLGLYLALTGARAKAADCVYAGVATHYLPTEKMVGLADALSNEDLCGEPHSVITHVLDAYAEDTGHPPLSDRRSAIDRHFRTDGTLDDVLASLRGDDSDFAKETLATLERMSPTSMRLTFEQMKRGAGLEFDEVMKMEFRIVRRVMEGRDFFEGVRAQIIDKDRNPKWSPASLSDVSDADIGHYFDDLGEEELHLP